MNRGKLLQGIYLQNGAKKKKENSNRGVVGSGKDCFMTGEITSSSYLTEMISRDADVGKKSFSSDIPE